MQQSLGEDEFDLGAAWDALSRRKYVVGAFFLAGLIAGIALQAGFEPVYESNAVLLIGRVGGVGKIQPAAELVQQLTQAHKVGDAGRTMPYLSSVREAGEEAIVLTAAGHDPESSRAFLRSELEKILHEHAAIFDEVSGQQKRAKEALAARIAAIEERSRALGDRAETILERNPAVGAVLLQDQIRMATELAELEKALHTLELDLSRIATSPSRVLREPTLTQAPGLRARLFFVVTGAVLGLVLGCVAALALDAVQRRNAQAVRAASR